METTAMVVPAAESKNLNRIIESPFDSTQSFVEAQRIANLLSASTIVPLPYRGREGVSNCVIALEMSRRLGISILSIMQNMYVVNGHPSFSSSMMISIVNSCGQFSRLQFETSGSGESLECYAWAIDKTTGKRLDGVKVTWTMAKKEGWISKGCSKWQTMPELMIRYRAAAFWARLYCPDLLMGVAYLPEEAETIAESETPQEIPTVVSTNTSSNTIAELNALLDE